MRTEGKGSLLPWILRTEGLTQGRRDMLKGSSSELRKMVPETWPQAVGWEEISREGVSVELGLLTEGHTALPRLARALGLLKGQSS